MLIGIYGELQQNMELHTCNNLSSLAIESAFFVLSYGRSHVFLSRKIYYTPLFFSCPSTQSADMEKTETSV